jgi:hypothetical protein
MNLRTVGFGLTVVAVLVLMGSAIWGVVSPGAAVEDGDARVVSTVRPHERIRVEVLNGAGITGLARQVTEELRAAGFDVVYYGNAGSLSRDSTTILDRSGNAAAIATLSDAIDIDRVEEAIDTTLYLEATLVLGPDWVR